MVDIPFYIIMYRNASDHESLKLTHEISLANRNYLTEALS